MLRRAEIQNLVEEHGEAGYLQIQARLLGMGPDGQYPQDADGKPLFESKVKLPNGAEVRRVRPEEFSLRALWEGLVGPVEDTLGYCQDRAGFVEYPQAEFVEQVSTGAFPSAVGQLIATKVIEGYDAPGFIGDQLVTPMPSKLRGERVVGFTSLQGPKPVGEGRPYDESTFAEKYVGTVETKRGRLLSISEELVYFDQTGQILQRAANLGTKAREERERRIIRAVCDVASTERVYRPNGTAEQLYSSGNNNLLGTATVLTDWTDIQEVLAYHATNVTDDREPDDTLGTQPIVWFPRVLLTAVKLAGVAARIVSATISTSGNVEASNPLTAIIPGGLVALSSPFIDAAEGADQFDDADDWFLGDFKKQFIYKVIWPLQTFRAPAQNPEQWTRDVVAQYKVREYGDVNAVDERFVIKVNAAS